MSLKDAIVLQQSPGRSIQLDNESINLLSMHGHTWSTLSLGISKMIHKRLRDCTLLVKYVRRNDALLELQIRISVFGGSIL